MSEFSTIVSSDGSVLFVGSQISIKSHPIFKIIIAPKGIIEEVEILLNEIGQVKNSIHLIEKIQKAVNDKQMGPFTLIKKKIILTFGKQEAMKVPKLDYLMRHRLKSLLGLNPKIWSLDGKKLELLPFRL